MKKNSFTFVVLLMLLFTLSACNLPGAAQNTTTVVTVAPAIATKTIPATAIPQLNASETPVPPAATSVPIATPSLPALSVQPVNINQVHMITVDSGWGWAIRNGEMNWLLHTNDGGLTWKDVSPQGSYVYSGNYFLNDQVAWLSLYNGGTNGNSLLHTQDGGKTWETLPLDAAVQNAIFEFNSPNSGLAEIADMGAGNAYLTYYQTNDSGHSWQSVPLIAPSPESGLNNGTLHLCNICGDTLYFDGKHALITFGDMASDPQGVVRIAFSNDLGGNWINSQLPLPEKYTSGSVMPLTPSFFGDEGFMPVSLVKYGTGGGLEFSILLTYLSHDGGQSWILSPGILDGQQSRLDNIQVLSAQQAFVRCVSNLCVTNDAANTWQTLPHSLNFDSSADVQEYVSQVSFIDSSNGWAISGPGENPLLWKTNDGGQTWSQIKPSVYSAVLPSAAIQPTEDLRIPLSTIQNANYHSLTWGDFQMVNGIYYRPVSSPGESPELYSTQLTLPTIGDLNSDDQPDAAVVLVSYNGGNGNNKELAVLVNQNNAMTNVATIDIGFMVAAESLEIQSGTISLNVRVLGPNDALCCPSQKETWRFHLEGNQLVRIP